MQANEIENLVNKCVDAVFKKEFELAAQAFEFLEQIGAKTDFFDALARRVNEADDAEIVAIISKTAVPPEWLIYMSGALSDSRRYDLALSSLRAVEHNFPTYPNLYESIAFLYSEQGLFDEALTAARESVRLHPNDSYSYSVLGGLHQNRNELADAATAFRRSIELDGSDADTYWYLSMVLREQESWDEARTACRSAIALDADPYYFLELAKIEVCSGNNIAALGAIDDVTKESSAYEEAVKLREEIPD